jgi:hypothetical protein
MLSEKYSSSFIFLEKEILDTPDLEDKTNNINNNPENSTIETKILF